MWILNSVDHADYKFTTSTRTMSSVECWRLEDPIRNRKIGDSTARDA